MTIFILQKNDHSEIVGSLIITNQILEAVVWVLEKPEEILEIIKHEGGKFIQLKKIGDGEPMYQNCNTLNYILPARNSDFEIVGTAIKTFTIREPVYYVSESYEEVIELIHEQISS